MSSFNTHAHPVGFVRGVAVAAALALLAALGFSAAGLLWPTAAVFKALVTLLAGSYLAYLVRRAHVSNGRLLLPSVWLLGAALLAFMLDDALSLIVAHTFGIWLVRSLCYHNDLRAAGLDLAVSVLALTAALAAATHTHSVALSVWSFFLVQALFAAIPLTAAQHAESDNNDPQARFARAHAQAEMALRRLNIPA